MYSRVLYIPFISSPDAGFTPSVGPAPAETFENSAASAAPVGAVSVVRAPLDLNDHRRRRFGESKAVQCARLSADERRLAEIQAAIGTSIMRYDSTPNHTVSTTSTNPVIGDG